MQKSEKDVDMLKFGCTLANLANIRPHKSADAKFYPFTEADKDLLGRIREDVIGGPCSVFTSKAVVDDTFIRKCTNICKLIVGTDGSQLYPLSMCQPMPFGLCRRWDHDSETSRFTPRQNNTRTFQIMVMFYFQRARPDCKLEIFYTTGWQERIDCFSVDGVVFSLQYCVRSHGLFLSLLRLSRGASISQWKRSNVEVRRESPIHGDETLNRKRASLSSKCRNMSGGDFTRQPITTYPREFSLQRFTYRTPTSRKRGNFFGSFNSTLKYPNILEPFFLTPFWSSKTL